MALSVQLGCIVDRLRVTRDRVTTDIKTQKTFKTSTRPALWSMSSFHSGSRWRVFPIIIGPAQTVIINDVSIWPTSHPRDVL